MNQIRFLRGKQEDLDKLIENENANAFSIEKEESDSENETKNDFKIPFEKSF